MARSKSDKFTFRAVYKEFRKRFPRMAKHVLGFQPYGYMTIIMWVDDGSKLIYDGYLNKCKFTEERWKE